MANPSETAGMTYKDAGVDIDLGDDASKILFNAAKQTWKNRQGRVGEIFTPTEDFSGVRAIRIGGLPNDAILGLNSDGVGTKMEIAERIGDHRTIAYDLFAMVCDDAAIRGAEPILVASVLDVNSLGKDGTTHIGSVRQLAEGYISAAEAADVAVINGELAELGGRVGGYGDFNYNWGATVAWIAREGRQITGRDIRPGNAIVGFKEHGFRSNGLSLVRRILERHFGAEWHKHPAGRMAVRDVLTPSQIYSKLLTKLTGGFDDDPRARITGAAHITGGGLPGKLGRLIGPVGLGAHITDAMEPPRIMSNLQGLGNVADIEAYRTWNMGQGMVVTTPEPDAVMAVASEFGIESSVIGEVTDQEGISIVSKGRQNPGHALTF